jgi:hypothetical protein
VHVPERVDQGWLGIDPHRLLGQLERAIQLASGFRQQPGQVVSRSARARMSSDDLAQPPLGLFLLPRPQDELRRRVGGGRIPRVCADRVVEELAGALLSPVRPRATPAASVWARSVELRAFSKAARGVGIAAEGQETPVGAWRWRRRVGLERRLGRGHRLVARPRARRS